MVFVDSAFELLCAVPTRTRYSGAPVESQASVTCEPVTDTTLRLLGAVSPPFDGDGAGCDGVGVADGAVGEDGAPSSDPPHAIVRVAAIATKSIPTRFMSAAPLPNLNKGNGHAACRLTCTSAQARIKSVCRCRIAADGIRDSCDGCTRKHRIRSRIRTATFDFVAVVAL